MTITIKEIKNFIFKLNEVIQENKEYFIELDGKLGDGDLGLTLSKGFKAAVAYTEQFTGDEIGEYFLKLAMEINSVASSTFGTLLSSGIMEVGKNSRGKEKLSNEDLVVLFESFVKGIQKRGKAKLGDKTVLDALIPAKNEFKEAINKGEDPSSAIKVAAQAADKGVEKTKELTSEHGRASYYGEKSKGLKDPGAEAANIVLDEIKDYLN